MLRGIFFFAMTIISSLSLIIVNLMTYNLYPIFIHIIIIMYTRAAKRNHLFNILNMCFLVIRVQSVPYLRSQGWSQNKMASDSFEVE